MDEFDWSEQPGGAESAAKGSRGPKMGHSMVMPAVGRGF